MSSSSSRQVVAATAGRHAGRTRRGSATWPTAWSRERAVVAEDVLASVRERAHANLFWQYLGVEVEAAGEGWVRLRVPIRDELRNAAGAPVHGGVLATLVDAAVGGALGAYGFAAARGGGQGPP